jgi:5'-phosphate synthase pdxT subunit
LHQTAPTSSQTLTIGILALQGAYEAHAGAIRSLGQQVKLIRTPDQLYRPEGGAGIDGLIIPGGESTTMLKFLERNGFLDALTSFVREVPTFGTCAGAILLAKDVQHPAQTSLAVLDITIERNAYGRQIDSTILTAPTALPGGPLEMVFIRAPRIIRTGPQVETLGSREGSPVFVRQGHLLAATFHPELSSDTRVHRFFLDLIRQNAGTQPEAQSVATQPHS